MASSSKRAPAAAERPRDGEFDPMYEWLDDGDSYLLRLNLPGFKKEDFRVHVDAAGRLTVISQGAGRAPPRLHKAFQLPNTANLDGITGRFDGSVLTLTVPKLHAPSAAALAPLPKQTKEEHEAAADEPKRQQPQEDKPAAPPKVGPGHADAAAERTNMPVRREHEKDDKSKAVLAAPPLPAGEKKNDGVRPRERDEKQAAADDHRAYVACEAARRIEAARAKVAEAKAAAERTGGQWKERVASEGLKLAETIGKNKEIVATAVAAFTLGVLVSQACSRR